MKQKKVEDTVVHTVWECETVLEAEIEEVNATKKWRGTPN